MAEELNLIENTDLIQLKQDIIDLKGELSDNQSLIFYYDTETEGLAYGQRELDIELKRNPGRDKQQDKIVEFGGVVAIRTINEDGTKTIDPTNLGFRNFYNPNLDRDKNKARVMDQIIVDIHGTTFDTLEAKENIVGTNQRLATPAPSLHAIVPGSENSYIEMTIELLNLTDEIRAHNATFDLGMINAAIADHNEILRLENNKTIDERLEPLKVGLKTANTELENVLADDLPEDEVQDFKNIVSDIEAKMDVVKTSRIINNLKSRQIDTLSIYQKHLPLAYQTYLTTNGVGFNEIVNSHKQDRMMDLTEYPMRDLHGAYEDSLALLEVDSRVQANFLNPAQVRDAKINNLNYISTTTQDSEFKNIWEFANELPNRIPTEDQLFDKLSPEIEKPNLRTRGLIETTQDEFTSAVQYALELESEIFQKADSIDDYNALIAKKIESIKSIPSQIKKRFENEPKHGSVKIALEISRIYFNEKLKGEFAKLDYSPKNFSTPEITTSVNYIRTHNSIPTKSSKETLLPQVIGSVKDPVAEIEYQYSLGNKEIVLMDYNNIVDLYDKEDYISELTDKYPDLKITYGFTTLLKHNNEYSELNIILPGKNPQAEFEKLSHILTDSSKKDFVDANGELKLKGGKTLKAPNLSAEEVVKFMESGDLIFTMGSYAGILNRMILDGKSDDHIIQYLNTLPQEIKEDIKFEFFDDSAIVETRKTNILSNLDFKPNLIYSKPTLHSKGMESLHSNRVHALGHSDYSKDSLGVSIYSSNIEADNLPSIDIDNMVLPHQEVKISDYVDLDVSEKWDPQLYGEIKDGNYTEEEKFASLPKTLSSLNEISPIPSGSYKEQLDLKKIQRDIFIKRTMSGLKTRLSSNGIPDTDVPGYLSRVDMEMSTLIDMQFDGYMLDVQGFLDTLKTKLDGETGPGRGSAAGSLVAYALRITNVDPIQHDLIFERFLNKERVSWPDIDMDMQGKQMTINKVINSDLPQEFKDLVLTKYSNKSGDTSGFDDELAAKDLLTLWLKARYGREHVKNILTKGTYGAKRAIETICKNYGNEYALSVNPNYKNFGGQAYIHLATDIKGAFFEKVGSNIKDALDSEEFLAVYNSSPAMAQIIDEALEIEGTLSTFGVHAAGALKSAKDRTWVQVATMNIDGEETSPIPGKKIEDEVDIKFDFLGLKTLLVIRDCIDIVNKVDGIDLSDEIYDKANYINDKKAYDQIRSGDSEGLFQIESAGMKQLAKKLQPDCFEDIVAMLALFRPGPLESGMVDDFIERKHGRQEIDYFDDSLEPALKPILENTYGVIVYQEQVMKIVQEIGGFTLGDADLVRRAMGKKIPEEMDKLKGDFVAGALKKGYKQQIASDLFDLIVKFAGYGFNKSHSAAYAFVTMQTAMLKANHKRAFYTALVIDKSSTIENLESIIPEILKSGIGVGAPDINVSYIKPQLRNEKIYYGLDTIKGTKTSDIKTIIESRNKNGDYKDLKDLMSRSEVVISKSTFEGLARSGALDALSIESTSFEFPNTDTSNIIANRASLIFWYENFTKAKAPTKTQLIAMRKRYDDNAKLSTAQDSEYKILGSIISNIDRKLNNPVDFEDIKSMPDNAIDGSTKIIGDATIIDVVSGVNKFGKFYQITLLDSQNRRQNFSLSKPQIKAKDDRKIELKAGDIVEVTINKSINVENDTVHTSLKDINLYDEDNEFLKTEVLGADIFTVVDLDASKLNGSDPISLKDLDEHIQANQSYHNGKKSAKYTYFLKSFQQTAKKTGYVLEVSDGENNTKVFVSGVSNIDEKEFSNNINLPITLEFNKYEQDFVMTKYNTKPELPGAKTLTESAKVRESAFIDSLGGDISQPSQAPKKSFRVEAYNNGSTIFISGLSDDLSRTLELETGTKVYGNRVYYNNQSQKKKVTEKLIEMGFGNLDLTSGNVVEIVDKIKYPVIFTTENSLGEDVVFSRSECADIKESNGDKYLKYSSEDNATSIWFNKSDATCGNIHYVQAADADIQKMAEPLQIEIRDSIYPPVKSRLADKAQDNIKNKSKSQ